MIELKNSKGTECIYLPTNVNEVTKENLEIITKNINLPKNYCIVALCATTRLFDIAMSCRSKKQDNLLGIVPIMAKINDNEVNVVNARIGERVITDRTSVELGTQINAGTIITMNNVAKFIMNDDKLYNEILTTTNKEKSVIYKAPIIVLSFKMIPLCNIHGSYNNESYIDPYKRILNNKDN